MHSSKDDKTNNEQDLVFSVKLHFKSKQDLILKCSSWKDFIPRL